jgi:D-glutamate cyclase
VTDPILTDLERLIRTDPARRGLIASEPEFGPLLPGHLGRAAQELASYATSVGIVTGFYIPSATPPAAETDGPLGAILLAETLRQLGVAVGVITDESCQNAVQAAARHFHFPLEFVHPPQATHYSHLVSIERVGPSHTLESLQLLHPGELEVPRRFEQLVPIEDRGRCFNMRGVCIDEWTAPLHRLFEEAASQSPVVKTIGIGDGGNEIGMGSIPWTELVRRLPEPHGGKIACRISCDWTILAGVSNWGGYALAAAVAHLRGRVEILEPWTGSQQFAWLEAVVRDGPAVDGVTRLAQPTVDGLPFATYIQPWDAMRQLLGLKR